MIGLRHAVTNKKQLNWFSIIPDCLVIPCLVVQQSWFVRISDCCIWQNVLFSGATWTWSTLKISFLEIIFINRNWTNHQHRHLVTFILKYFRVFCGSVTLKEQVYCDIYKWNLLSQTGSVTRESFSLVINVWFNHLNQYYVPDMTRVLGIPPSSGVT